MLDALLMSAVATRDGLEPLPKEHRGPTNLPIPVSKSECGRVFLCSQGFAAVECHESPIRFKNRRFPVLEAQVMGGPKVRSINIQGGPNLSYHLPMDTVLLRDDQVRWWAVGEPQPMRDLLDGWVGFLGHRRAVGLGKVTRWQVEGVDPWEGFPVMRDGLPLRPLPPDWPGLRADVEMSHRTLLPPYWRRSEEELCAVPSP